MVNEAQTPRVYTPGCEIKSGMQVPEGWQRWCAKVEYNGAAYKGFQKQASTPDTIQAELEQAFSNIADHPVTLSCAGRTDAGVHAVSQIVHFDTRVIRPLKAWVEGANTKLKSSVRVKFAQPISFDFHARFSARARTYRYLTLLDERPSAHLSGLVTWQKYRLNVDDMAEASRCLVGEHDFSSFRASQCQAKSPVRNIHHIKFSQQGALLVMEIKANAFLHHMVRNTMGALFEIGRGAKPASWLQSVLEACDRRQNAATAPADGLYFVGVEYPELFSVPSQPEGPVFLSV